MISEMEACQTKMYKAMADVQTTSIAAFQATTASPTPSPRASTIGATTATSVGAVPPGVMIERANVAMMKLTGILKSKKKKA
jgi:hypothetical protein